MFDSEKVGLEVVFGLQAIGVYHVGSTAVPGLAAKPEIDVLVVVSDFGPQAEIERSMESIGYFRGKDLSEGHQFYRRDLHGVRTHKVHVCIAGHWQISRMLQFRDMLRSDDALRESYQNLKLALESSNEHGIKEYLARKAPFIDAAVSGSPSGRD